MGLNIDLTYILLLLLNGMIGLAFFVLSVVYFFVEAKHNTMDDSRKTLLISGILCLLGVVISVMTRYFIEFPEVEGYNLNSDFYFFTNLLTSIFSFFSYIFYIRCGQHFALEKGLTGSLYLRGEAGKRPIDWKLILIPMPFLIAWTFVWFGMFTLEPTELLQATTPEKEDLVTYIYMFLSVSIAAPLKEEIFYRHFAMGLFYKWFGKSKAAVAFNIIISALLFSVAHVAVVTDDWVKIVQIIPAGLLFGWINYKRGLEHSVLAHALFNTLVIPVSMIVEYFA